MTIRTRLLISNILSIGIALLIGVIFFWTSGRVDEVLVRSRVVEEVAQGVFELNMLTADYLLHREERALSQWGLKHESLMRLLEGVEYREPTKREVFKRIKQNHMGIEGLFLQLVANYESRKAGEGNTRLYWELEERIVGQLMVKSQAMVSGAFFLDETSHGEALTVERWARYLVIIFVLVLATILTATSFLIRRSVVRPITALHEGTEKIGAGNLDHKVGTQEKDEIGQLSRAFDRMTENLKN